MVECERAVHRYLDWLGGQFKVESDGDDCIVVSPFEDPWGDFIEVRVRPSREGGFLVSDSGSAIENLFLAGVDPISPGRKKTLDVLLQDNHVTLQDGEIVAVAQREEEVPAAVHQVKMSVASRIQWERRFRGNPDNIRLISCFHKGIVGSRP